MMNDTYTPLTIYDMIELHLSKLIERSVSTEDSTVRVYAVNDRVKARYEVMINRNRWNKLNSDVLIIDITSWKKIGKTIHGRRADRLKNFCKQYKNAASAVIVYNDANPAEQVIEAVRSVLPDLQMQHFSTCNNIAGNNRALWFTRP